MYAPDTNTLQLTPEESHGFFPSEVLTTAEEWWQDHYELLKQHGYLLRPRYRPGWTPSPNSGKPGLRRNKSDEFMDLPVCPKLFTRFLAETVISAQT
jgi:hypothetical protein